MFLLFQKMSPRKRYPKRSPKRSPKRGKTYRSGEGVEPPSEMEAELQAEL